jgi:hypothetical protein
MTRWSAVAARSSGALALLRRELWARGALRNSWAVSFQAGMNRRMALATAGASAKFRPRSRLGRRELSQTAGGRRPSGPCAWK